MTTPTRLFAIGDVQGCYDELRALLDKLCFDPLTDHLWLTGDLVNRGPDSLAVLRFVHSLGDSASVVLGNHDLHLLAVSCGARRPHKRDTFAAVLDQDDAPALLEWLRHLPLMIERDLGHHHVVLSHAGIYPMWSLAQARQCAKEVETVLKSDDWTSFCHHMYGDGPEVWSNDLAGWPRLRFITNVFTRMRMLDGMRVDLSANGAPEKHPDLVPWFDVPRADDDRHLCVFGHWSTLGYLRTSEYIALDTGCLWGGCLTAVRLLPSPLKKVQTRCPGYAEAG